MSTVAPQGLHHVTAIAGNPQRNVDFYTKVLGLRLVKQTVNFDAPDTYHLYYGDEAGRPASLLTFFPWDGVPGGRLGTGLTTATAFSIPQESTSWWLQRLRTLGVDVQPIVQRGGTDVITLRDPDGMVLDLVSTAGDQRSGWDGVASIPADHAVRGLHAVTLTERLLDPTAEMLTSMLGMQLGGEEGSRASFAMGTGDSGALVDVAGEKAMDRGLQAGGTVHHVAFRAPDLPTMLRWHDELADAGVRVTEILDRQYFKSIYFREPGGVLFEIATDAPGFDIDEPLLELGRSLQLPPWLEPDRDQIRASLPVLKVDEPTRAPVSTGAEPAATSGVGRRPDRRAMTTPRVAATAATTTTPDTGTTLARPHVWVPGDPGWTGPPLLLLHGTGGSERDLLPLGRELAPGAPLLAPRGTVLEGTMPRFFRRLREGVFDETDLLARADELADFLAAAAREYGVTPGSFVAVGFSNGANIASALLLTHPEAVRDAILIAAMPPFGVAPAADLTGHRVLISNGRRDPMAPLSLTTRLVDDLGASGATVDLRLHAGGHQLAADHLPAMRAFLEPAASPGPPEPAASTGPTAPAGG